MSTEVPKSEHIARLGGSDRKARGSLDALRRLFLAGDLTEAELGAIGAVKKEYLLRVTEGKLLQDPGMNTRAGASVLKSRLDAVLSKHGKEGYVSLQVGEWGKRPFDVCHDCGQSHAGLSHKLTVLRKYMKDGNIDDSCLRILGAKWVYAAVHKTHAAAGDIDLWNTAAKHLFGALPAP